MGRNLTSFFHTSSVILLQSELKWLQTSKSLFFSLNLKQFFRGFGDVNPELVLLLTLLKIYLLCLGAQGVYLLVWELTIWVDGSLNN